MIVAILIVLIVASLAFWVLTDDEYPPETAYIKRAKGFWE